MRPAPPTTRRAPGAARQRQAPADRACDRHRTLEHLLADTALEAERELVEPEFEQAEEGAERLEAMVRAMQSNALATEPLGRTIILIVLRDIRALSATQVEEVCAWTAGALLAVSRPGRQEAAEYQAAASAGGAD